MKLSIPFLIVFVSISFVSCSSDGGGGSDPMPPSPPQSTPPPSSANLIFPEDNTECNEGEAINDLESRVTFRWSAAANADSYQVTVTNLNTNATSNVNSTETEVPITIDRGTPYAWFVVSRSDSSSETATSNTARFFNQGPGIENYAPFPASVVNPIRGSTVSSGTVQLEWEGGDIDDDVLDFQILFGTENPPSTILGNTSNNQFDTTVVSDTIYYWRVITLDSAGNTSQSEIFQFRVR